MTVWYSVTVSVTSIVRVYSFVAVTGRYSVEGGDVQSFHVATFPKIVVSAYVPVTNIETSFNAERGLGASMVMLYLYHTPHRQYTQERAT